MIDKDGVPTPVLVVILMYLAAEAFLWLLKMGYLRR